METKCKMRTSDLQKKIEEERRKNWRRRGGERCLEELREEENVEPSIPY